MAGVAGAVLQSPPKRTSNKLVSSPNTHTPCAESHPHGVLHSFPHGIVRHASTAGEMVESTLVDAAVAMVVVVAAIVVAAMAVLVVGGAVGRQRASHILGHNFVAIAFVNIFAHMALVKILPQSAPSGGHPTPVAACLLCTLHGPPATGRYSCHRSFGTTSPASKLVFSSRHTFVESVFNTNPAHPGFCAHSAAHPSMSRGLKLPAEMSVVNRGGLKAPFAVCVSVQEADMHALLSA